MSQDPINTYVAFYFGFFTAVFLLIMAVWFSMGWQKYEAYKRSKIKTHLRLVHSVPEDKLRPKTFRNL